MLLVLVFGLLDPALGPDVELWVQVVWNIIPVAD